MFALWDVLCTRHNISMFCGINHTNVKLSNLHSLLSCTRQYILERHHFLTPRKRWFSPGTMWLTHKVPWVPHDWLNYFQIATTCSSSFFVLLLPPLSFLLCLLSSNSLLFLLLRQLLHHFPDQTPVLHQVAKVGVMTKGKPSSTSSTIFSAQPVLGDRVDLPSISMPGLSLNSSHLFAALKGTVIDFQLLPWHF